MGFPTLSRFDLAQELIDSIDHPVKHLVIVDNSGSMEFEPKPSPYVENHWIIRVPFGLGLQGAWNLVIKSTPYASRWLLVNDDCKFEPGALAIIDAEAKTDAITFTDCQPVWSAFVLGEQVVHRVGLFDESFYPLYFCDNDYERRADALGIPKRQIPAKVHHVNSASKFDGNTQRNDFTFSRNAHRFQNKIDNADFSDHGWSLAVRREQRWD
jgi:GT2 family glycosyltransferase